MWTDFIKLEGQRKLKERAFQGRLKQVELPLGKSRQMEGGEKRGGRGGRGQEGMGGSREKEETR